MFPPDYTMFFGVSRRHHVRLGQRFSKCGAGPTTGARWYCRWGARRTGKYRNPARSARSHYVRAARTRQRQIDSQSAALPPLSLPERTSTVPISQWAARTSLSACKQEAGARPGGRISRCEGVVSLCGAAARPTPGPTKGRQPCVHAFSSAHITAALLPLSRESFCDVEAGGLFVSYCESTSIINKKTHQTCGSFSVRPDYLFWMAD